MFHEPSSRFIIGLPPNRWTFSRSMGGPTSHPDGAVCRTEGDIETPFDVISMRYALRFCETESEFVRLVSKTSRN
jgi:hypothetical protein